MTYEDIVKKCIEDTAKKMKEDKELAGAIAEYMLEKCIECPNLGNWVFSLNELSEKFARDPEWIGYHENDICVHLHEKNENTRVICMVSYSEDKDRYVLKGFNIDFRWKKTGDGHKSKNDRYFEKESREYHNGGDSWAAVAVIDDDKDKEEN